MSNKTLSIIKYLPILIYAIWAVAGTVVAVCGNPMAGLSFIWIPLVVIFLLWLVFSLAWVYGDKIKADSPESCQNCVFHQQREIQGLCLGEQLGYIYGNKCKCYSRYHYDKPGTEIKQSK